MSRAFKKLCIMMMAFAGAIDFAQAQLWTGSSTASSQPQASQPQTSTQSSGGGLWSAPSRTQTAAPKAPPSRALWRETVAQPAPAQQADREAPSVTAAPELAVPQAQVAPQPIPAVVPDVKSKLQADAGVECKDCRPDQLEALRRTMNAYAEAASRSLVSNGVARVMNVTYQRCDADNASMLVPPDYYNPGFHNDDSQDGGLDNRYHNYQGAESKQPGDMKSWNDDNTSGREWFSYSTLQRLGTFYTKKGAPAPGCRDMRLTPPVFCDGGRSKYSQSSAGRVSIDVFNNTSVPGRCQSPNFVTFDCSNLVSSVYLASGLKFYKDKPASTQVTTNELLGFLNPKPNACISPATFTKNKSLESGDIIVFDSHHSMIIDSVGADPFGIKTLPANKSCSELDPDNFDITVAQAGLFGGRMGPARERYQDLLTTYLLYPDGTKSKTYKPVQVFDQRKAALMDLAIQACNTARNGGIARASVKHTLSDGTVDGVNILRAVGMKDPDCYVHKPQNHPDCADRNSYACLQPYGAKMAGEECLNSCGFDTSGEAQ